MGEETVADKLESKWGNYNEFSWMDGLKPQMHGLEDTENKASHCMAKDF